MSRNRMTRSELKMENATLRDRLGEARDLIDEALGLEGLDSQAVDEDDDEGEEDEDDEDDQ